MKEKLFEKLREVIDPHTGMDIVSMGLVKEIKIENEKVKISITPTSPFCPVGEYLLRAVEAKIASLGYIADVKLENYLFKEGD
ncbi:metal-sulfur cluster assembly factor [Thermocrinis jamiesonii]|uniref:metal-sulfur cluster assembly factor n=1 Tax=Thermocrinis jamiesonii TaxID=1302351 RepID=UPI000496CD10|nr:metal-sulfur cluster assembly factor [Thermocrinis jamiesonii]